MLQLGTEVGYPRMGKILPGQILCFLPEEGSLWDWQGVSGARGGLMSRVRPPHCKGPPPHIILE